MILIIGSEGSMGKRYQAILRYLGKKFQCLDLHNQDKQELLIKNSEGYIVATPTDTHQAYIRMLLQYRKPILCEKPICKNVEELKTLFEEIEKSETPFRMMFQYALLSEANRVGRSHYNYFRHGSDGLVWDCLQIIGLARGPIELNHTSPIWTCILNGRALKIGDMDAAYIGYVQKWFSEPSQNLSKLLAIHQKTDSLVKSNFYG